MNRRQEIALWVLALLLAGPLLRDALDELGGEQFFPKLFEPVLILAPLVVYSLRTRSAASPTSSKTAAGVVVLVLLAGVSVHVGRRLEAAESAADGAASKADEAESQISEVGDAVNVLTTEVSELSEKVDALER